MKNKLLTITSDQLDPATLYGYASDFANDYGASDSSYLCDAFSEFADGATSIYYSDIMEFIKKNPDALADVVNEGLYDLARDYDLYKHGQAAEFLAIEKELWEAEDDIIKTLALEYLENILTDEKAAEFFKLSDDEQTEKLDDLEKALLHPDRLDDIADAIDEFLTFEGVENE